MAVGDIHLLAKTVVNFEPNDGLNIRCQLFPVTVPGTRLYCDLHLYRAVS